MLNGKYSEEQDGFTSLKDTTANHSNKEHTGMNPEPRIPPPNQKPVSVAAFKRTSPNGRKKYPSEFLNQMNHVLDIVGFSAIRASGFSRAGNSRIYFEKTVKKDLQCLVWILTIFSRLPTPTMVGTARTPCSSPTSLACTSSRSP